MGIADEAVVVLTGTGHGRVADLAVVVVVVVTFVQVGITVVECSQFFAFFYLAYLQSNTIN